MTKTADIDTMLFDLERDAVLAIREELALLADDAQAVVTDSSSEANPVTITRYGDPISAREAIAAIDAA